MHTDWASLIQAESQRPYFQALLKRVMQAREQGAHIFPPAQQTFEALHQTPFDKVRVVIVGQDPYHRKGQAHGLAFSVPHGQPVPPSLRNIYKAIQHDFPHFTPPPHGCLLHWAQQGVLLLNTVLTVTEGQAQSHAGWGWEHFTDAIIERLHAEHTGLVFMLWGKAAQAKGANIDPMRHCVLHSVHPSPLSTHRGFLHCGHFAKANTYLVSQGQAPIDWQLPLH